jgi:hypothetical protein
MRNPIAHGFDATKYALDMIQNEPLKLIQNLLKIRPWINTMQNMPDPLFK